MKKDVVYIVSGVEKSLAFEWIISELDKRSVKLSFIVLGKAETPLTIFLQSKGIKWLGVTYRSKKDLPWAFFKICRFLLRCRPAVVHTHLFEASFIGLTAARLLGIRKRIYTRHHATIHHTYFPKAVKYDKWINWCATDIVAISRSVKEILISLEGVAQKKIVLIYHGFDFSAFDEVSSARIELLKQKYGLRDTKSFVVGVVARYTEWKGIHYVIQAVKDVLADYPELVLVLAGAKGDFSTELKEALSGIPLKNFREIEFEKDIIALYSLMDVYVHVPVDPVCEAFGQTYVESLAARVPAIFTLSGIAREFIVHEQNAYVVPFRSAADIEAGIREILTNDAMRNKMIESGYHDVRQRFGVSYMADALRSLYGV